MASIRTDGTIWRERGKEEGEEGIEGGREKSVGRITERRRRSRYKDGVMLRRVIVGRDG